MSAIAVVSYRLGLADGVSVESQKWCWALRELGHDVRTVAGEGTADVLVEGLALRSIEPPDHGALRSALDGADVVIAENICSLPLNALASTAVARALEGRPAVLHHHDLPWQRPALDLPSEIPTDARWRHVTINELSARELRVRGIEATVIPNHFDLSPPLGERTAMRRAIGVRRTATLVVHPVRAIPRKNVGAALRFAERMGAVYWLVGGPEDGYGPELDRLFAFARTGLRQGMPQDFTIADVYAASDIVVLSSTWEGFGNAAIESVAHRRPLARYPYPVMEEVERNGLRFFDLDAIHALEKFVERPDEELLDENLRAARAVYDLALLPDQLDAVLQGLHKG